MNIEVLADSESVAQRAASIIVEEPRNAAVARGFFVMAVSRGHTPWLMLRALANANVPWPAIHIVQVDERVSASGHPDRNVTHAGTPMALAPLVYTIWNRVTRFDPQAPLWPNRDRFVRALSIWQGRDPSPSSTSR